MLIEATGISEPLPIAETFTFEDENGQSLSHVARLYALVTVVDAANFLDEYEEAFALQGTGGSLGEDDDRSVPDLLVGQIESSNIVLLSKTDLVDAAQAKKVMAVIRSLNPEAEIIPISGGQVALDKGRHRPVCRLIRSKGYFWLASHPTLIGQWNQAGGIARHGFAGTFRSATPRDQWPTDAEAVDYIEENWGEPFGDMRQELVFIGQSLNQDQLCGQLDACLLNDDELYAGTPHWLTLENPFIAQEA